MGTLVRDDLRALTGPLRPPALETLNGGRPHASDRAPLAGIILILRTDMQRKRAASCSA